MVADASIVDGRLEPGRRRGWNVYTGCVCAQNAGHNPGFSVGWGLVVVRSFTENTSHCDGDGVSVSKQ